jgi:predicted nucleic acid-binding protein
MDEVLIDTSAWIAALRGADPVIQEAVDHLLELDKALFCGVVEMELLQGIRAKERDTLLPLFEALPFIELDRDDWRAAGTLLNELRAKGKIIPSTDAIIAMLCLRHDVPLLTLDKHFDAVPRLRRFNVGGKKRK